MVGGAQVLLKRHEHGRSPLIAEARNRRHARMEPQEFLVIVFDHRIELDLEADSLDLASILGRLDRHRRVVRTRFLFL